MIYYIIYFVLLVAALGWYNALLVKDDRMNEDDPRNANLEVQWHIAGGIVFFLIAWGAWKELGWPWAIFVLALFWLLFAGIVHITALGKSFFFVGTTALSDKIINWINNTFKIGHAEKVAMILKTVTIIVSIILLILVT